MDYRVTVEKLKKGWMTTFFVASKQAASKLASLIGSISVNEGLEGKKYATTLKPSGKKSYTVNQYRSKLRQVNTLMYELFKQVRDNQEAGSGRVAHS